MSYDDAAQTGNVLWDFGENLLNKQMLILCLTETVIQKKKKNQADYCSADSHFKMRGNTNLLSLALPCGLKNGSRSMELTINEYTWTVTIMQGLKISLHNI